MEHPVFALERTFERFVACHPDGDLMLLRHRNGLLVICLAESHPLRKGEMRVKDVSFRVQAAVPTGKHKKDSRIVKPRTVLCDVTSTTGLKYTVKSMVQGRLFEVNGQLAENPNLLVDEAECSGFVAIVKPLSEHIESEEIVPSAERPFGHATADAAAWARRDDAGPDCG